MHILSRRDLLTAEAIVRLHGFGWNTIENTIIKWKETPKLIGESLE